MSEKKFTSCFVGIPLPDKFQKDFEGLLEKVGGIDPSLEVAYGDTPHLTVYYMDEQSQDNIDEIREIVDQEKDILKGSELEVGGMDTFGEELPRVLFLPIKYPEELVKFNTNLIKSLERFITFDDQLQFHPHMTVARFRNLAAQQNWVNSKDKIQEEMGKINWQFPITEVVIYGVDSKRSPQHQEKLVRIPV